MDEQAQFFEPKYPLQYEPGGFVFDFNLLPKGYFCAEAPYSIAWGAGGCLDSLDCLSHRFAFPLPSHLCRRRVAGKESDCIKSVDSDFNPTKKCPHSAKSGVKIRDPQMAVLVLASFKPK